MELCIGFALIKFDKDAPTVGRCKWHTVSHLRHTAGCIDVHEKQPFCLSAINVRQDLNGLCHIIMLSGFVMTHIGMRLIVYLISMYKKQVSRHACFLDSH